MAEMDKLDELQEEENETIDFEQMRDNRIDEMAQLLEEKKMKLLQTMLEENDEFDVAEFLSSLPAHQMAVVFRMLSKEHGAAVFAELDTPEQEYIINAITDNELGNILDELYLDDTVDMMEELPANVVKRVMRIATPETRKLINQYLKYPDNSAGSIMTAEFIDLKKYMSVKESFARIRRIGADKETIYTCFVTSADRRLEGIVTVRDLIMADEDVTIEEIMNENVIFCRTVDDQEDVSGMFSDYDLLTIPVVDKENRLVGIVTVDDVMDVMEQEATEDFEKMAAMLPSEKPYLKTSVFRLAFNRIPWLTILMLSSMITGGILSRYEEAFAAVPLLVTFMPMLMGTGGNSGSQASTMIIRGMSVGEVEPGDILKVMWKELRVGVICGLVLGLINYVRLMLQYPGNSLICLTVVISIFFTVILAKTIGCVLPIVAKVVHLDPAIMAAPMITTIVDTCSMMIYFQLACWLLDMA